MPLNFLCARFSLPKCHFHPDLPVFLGLGGINGIYWNLFDSGHRKIVWPKSWWPWSESTTQRALC